MGHDIGTVGRQGSVNAIGIAGGKHVGAPALRWRWWQRRRPLVHE
jgi:hypothetical protein